MTTLSGRVRLLVVCVASLFVMLLFSACAGVATTSTTNASGTTTTSQSVSGTIQSVNASNNSVVVNVNGQSYTITGLSPQQIAALQNQVGQRYTFQVTQAGTNAYTLNSGSQPVESNNTASAPASTPQGPVAQGSISFNGTVQGVNTSSITMILPNGNTLSMSLAPQTDRGDFGSGLPTVGQKIKVKATTNLDGSFYASKLDILKADDLADQIQMNTVDYSGVTTSAVGSDNVLHFNVGNRSYSFTISPTTQIKHLPSAQAIGANQPVSVEVLYNNGNPSVTKVDLNND